MLASILTLLAITSGHAFEFPSVSVNDDPAQGVIVTGTYNPPPALWYFSLYTEAGSGQSITQFSNQYTITSCTIGYVYVRFIEFGGFYSIPTLQLLERTSLHNPPTPELTDTKVAGTSFVINVKRTTPFYQTLRIGYQITSRETGKVEDLQVPDNTQIIVPNTAASVAIYNLNPCWEKSTPLVVKVPEIPNPPVVYLIGQLYAEDMSVVSFTPQLADNTSEQYKAISTGLATMCEDVLANISQLQGHVVSCQLERIIDGNGFAKALMQLELNNMNSSTCLPITLVLEIANDISAAPKTFPYTIRYTVDLYYPDDKTVETWMVSVKGDVSFGNGTKVQYIADYGNPKSEQYKELQATLIDWVTVSVGAPRIQSVELVGLTQDGDGVIGVMALHLVKAEFVGVSESRCITFTAAASVLNALNYQYTKAVNRMTDNQLIDSA